MSIINTADIGKLKKNKVALAGGTMTGVLVLSGDPTLNLHASTKQYVDNVQSDLFTKSGVDITIKGNLIPDGDNTRSLGSPTASFKDVYIGPGSLYVNGQKVIHDTGGTLVISADPNQNIDIQTQGTGDLSFSPAAGNTIELNGTVQVMAGMNVVSSDGNNISFANGLAMNNETIAALLDPVAAQDASTKAYTDTKLGKSGGTMTGNTDHPDSIKSRWGGGNDLQIYHDGSNSYIDEVGTGNLNIRTDGLGMTLHHTGGSVDMAQFTQWGVVLFFNGSSKLTTTTAGIDVTGNIAVTGTVDGRDIAADGLVLDAGTVITNTSETFGGVDYVGVHSSTAPGAGVAIFPNANATDPGFMSKEYAGKLDGIETGSQVNVGTNLGDAVQTIGGVDYRSITSTTGTNVLVQNASATIPGMMSKEYAGKVDGIETGADVTDTTNVTAAGALMETGGTMTGNLSLGDTVKAQFGGGNDLQIYHDGSHGRIVNTTGNLNIRGNLIDWRNQADSTSLMRATDGGSVDLYCNNVKKLATTSTGVSITGTLAADGLTLGDNEKALFGGANDLQIFHNGYDSVIEDAGAGYLSIKTNGTAIEIYDTVNSAYMAQFTVGGAASLYNNGTQKLTTTSTGIDVAGVVTTHSVSLDNGQSTIDSGVATVSNVSIAVDSWATTEYQSSKYTITARGNGDKFQISELLIFHDNANNAHITEYGIMSSDGVPFVTYTVDVTAGNVRLMATLDAVWSGGNNVKFTRFAQDII
jgi:hypothetical protein